MKKFNNLLYSILVMLTILVSCKGTDIIDDVIVNPVFTLTQAEAALRIGESANLSAKYFDEYGIEKTVDFVWVSSQSQIVSVTPGGKITGLAAGIAQVYPQYKNTKGKEVTVTIVGNDNSIAKVIISATKASLTLNETLNLTALSQNINNQTVSGGTIEWFSENSAIITVNNTGQLKAVANGTTGIFARVNGVKSNIINFTVGSSSQLMGNFTAAGGYKAVGTATLKNQNGQMILELSSNFETSFALGTFIYLANSTNGSNVRSSGLEIAEIKSNGAKTFNVSQIKSNVTLQEYKFVIILCKPASLTFGFAELK